MTKPRDLAKLGGGFIQSGTGAVQRSVESKLKDTVSVKDFGAVGDGVADDTVAIQAAIDSVSQRGGIVYFPSPSKLYLTTQTLLITADSVRLVGAAPGVVNTAGSPYSTPGSGIYYTGTGPAIYFKGTVSTLVRHQGISHLTIDAPNGTAVAAQYSYYLHIENIRSRLTGNLCTGFANGSYAGSGYWIILDRCISCNLIGCVFQGTNTGNGIYAVNQSNGLRMIGCRLTANNTPGMFGCLIDDGASFLLSGSIFESWETALRIHTGAASSTFAISIQGCYFEDISDRAMYIGRADGAGAVGGVTITGCHFNLTSTWLNPGADGGLVIAETNGLFASGNNIYGNTSGRSGTKRYVLYLGNNAKNVDISQNNIVLGPDDDLVYRSPTATGTIQRQTGVATSVDDGGTISHGMSGIPEGAMLTSTVQGEMVAVTNKSATTLTVSIKKHDNTPGTTQTIYWTAWQ